LVQRFRLSQSGSGISVQGQDIHVQQMDDKLRYPHTILFTFNAFVRLMLLYIVPCASNQSLDHAKSTKHASTSRCYECPVNHLGQRQPKRQHLREVRRAQPSDRIPAGCCLETSSATTLVATLCDVVEDLRVGVGRRVDESNTALADRKASLVDQGQDTTECWGGG
jgi:hypothetical protein